MSLIVLNSHGQDPAEFENHFGRGLKLPRNAEICLCGVNLNRYNKHDEAVVIQDNNDAFIDSLFFLKRTVMVRNIAYSLMSALVWIKWFHKNKKFDI